ncbi:hypothetical protein M1563_01610 [Patescibacteria group bacterium]|nr:hypothetical protein [Patescibacteria group bacterium]
MKALPKSPAYFPPTSAIFGAIILLLVAFLGAFTYSAFHFKASSVSVPTIGGGPNQESPVTLPNLPAGSSENLPSGSTVQTKEEGIAVCQKSGVDYCWSAVAVSFKDLSVCNQAPDVKKCQDDANQLIQANADYQKEQGQNANQP